MKDKLKEEWRKESTLTGANIPDYVADWWLSKIEERDKALIEEIDKAKEDMEVYTVVADKRTKETEYTGWAQCRDCGRPRHLKEHSYNNGLEVAKSIISGNK